MGVEGGGGARDSETDTNDKLLYSALKPSTQNHACSQRQIHTVHTCQLSQAKTKPYIKTIIITIITFIYKAPFLTRAHSHSALQVLRIFTMTTYTSATDALRRKSKRQPVMTRRQKQAETERHKDEAKK